MANEESDVLTLLNYAGVVVFAAAGALAASRKQLDIIGFLFFAAMTGIGGGTLRDLILGRLPVFWVKEPAYILVCVATGTLVFFTAHLVEFRYRLLLWLDAVGLAVYSVMGAQIGIEATGSPIIAIVTGMLTATCGGVLRDILADEPSVLLRPEIYISAALGGAGAFVLGQAIGLPLFFSAMVGFVVAFALRGGAIHYGWTIRRYRPRPGRDPDDALRK
ncbi:trimeric intracellular cation channel family protein [Neorhizobium sp. NPDC001467]|uniref:trimeric intracellular cation channel family protein n=1 Tax=Neorhizobium sp. NPDC001467 TaxID=3390595 RepID=UPI003D0646A7